MPFFAIADGLPAGFSQALVERLTSEHKAVTEQQINTARELVQFSRAYYKGVKADDYVALVTKHKEYGILFKDGSPRITNGETVSVSRDKKEHEYKLHVEVDTPFGGLYELDATGKQIVTRPMKVGGETSIENTVSRTDQLSYARQTTRVIPSAGGILVEDKLHIILREEGQKAAGMKKQLGILFSRFLDVFRKELGAQE